MPALEGSQAIARTVALCRPQVVAAYPITPQTHIVEGIAKLVADGVFDCEMVSVESEHSAASVALGAAVAGSRAYTASASQGMLLMSEVLFDISGLRVPMVMTCANRALSAPLNIWNDHQDAMALRDCGWIQLYCASNQEAIDTTVQAFYIAERCELPVMVCIDGFTLTHTLEPLELPSQSQVDHFLPPYQFARTLNPLSPLTLGTLVGPEHFAEVRYAHHQAMLKAQSQIVKADQDWGMIVNRYHGGLLEVRGDKSSRLGILCMGSVLGTLEDALEASATKKTARLIKLRSYRPFPTDALREACADLDTLIVLERAISPGGGGIVGPEVYAALAASKANVRIINCAAGLGGRDMPLSLYDQLLELAAEPDPIPFRIIDADTTKLPEDER